MENVDVFSLLNTENVSMENVDVSNNYDTFSLAIFIIFITAILIFMIIVLIDLITGYTPLDIPYLIKAKIIDKRMYRKWQKGNMYPLYKRIRKIRKKNEAGKYGNIGYGVEDEYYMLWYNAFRFFNYINKQQEDKLFIDIANLCGKDKEAFLRYCENFNGCSEKHVKYLQQLAKKAREQE